jgi:predicted MFS family arabinose efflux permease
MRTIDNQPEDFFLNGWSLLLGIGLFVAPWYFGFASEAFAAWNAWIFGVTAVILAVLALMQTYDWEVYAIAAAGIWSCVAPWALGFQASIPATWAHVSFGVALIVSACSELWRLRESPAAYEV